MTIQGGIEGAGGPFNTDIDATHLVSVILKISRASLPMKFTDSSTGGNFGIGIVVDW